jgi:putative nucleotidyltransferase with HDIG domain
VAKQESKPRPAGKAVAPDTSQQDRARRRGVLISIALGASLVLSALLTLEPFQMGPVGLRGRLPQPGEIVDRSYKAPADITIVDRVATEELRRAETDKAPTVYDFDERRASAVAERTRAAFEAARQLLATQPAKEGAKPDVAATFLEALKIGAELPDSVLEVLVERRFDRRDEAALIAIVSPVIARMIVGDEANFRRRLERRAVVVREIGSGEERRPTPNIAVLSQESAGELMRAGADRELAEHGRGERKALIALAELWVRPNAELNLRATEERRQEVEAGVKEVTVTLRKGEIVVRDGNKITERDLRILEGIREQVRTTRKLKVFMGVSSVLFLLIVILWRFGTRAVQRFPRAPQDALFLVSVLVATVLGTRIGLFLCDAIAERPELAPLLPQGPEPLYFVMPVAAAAMLVRLVHSGETAALFSAVVALVVGMQVGGLPFAVFALIASLIGVLGAARVTQRGTLLRAGLRVGAGSALVVAALGLLEGDTLLIPSAIAIAVAFVGGSLSGVLVSGLAPLVESVFGYTTDVKLLELANREQSLLRELELRAPGTYHHSMMVGHLAEKAAEAIGANSLLAKVAGYYHDIGKMRRPHFFVENVSVHGGENRHERLTPSMSARIIQAHVKDGLEYGKGHSLADPIMSGIAQHHGTSIIRYFYEKAKEQWDPEKDTPVEEHDYRYPGPRPQTREAGILMLSDSVEAASRTLLDTSPARVQQLVQRIINTYFRDGQLNECSLTLRDLNAIARSFIDTLTAIRHERIDYPEATDAAGRKLYEEVDEGVVERLEPRTKDRPESPHQDRDDDLRRLGLP